MKNYKLLALLAGELEHSVKSRCNKDCNLDGIANNFHEVSSKTYIGRYDTHRTGDNRKKTTLEAKQAHDPEEIKNKKTCHSCGSPNHYADNFTIDRKEIFPREEETQKDQEGY
ncbi:hypothetical protein O181_095765 [Austropuccinia psidii MF-1]|uniref:Uncharacterized protein n=1 Tax=Austropuccinia psidii MF-1 TaxID=1389203 RepID=A0A9Q3J4F6_9BASI|nr:hypothetical protein [Austropuccinia psidii MF-1]